MQVFSGSPHLEVLRELFTQVHLVSEGNNTTLSFVPLDI